MKNSFKKVVLILISTFMLVVVLCSCGMSLENQLVGEWYLPNSSTPEYILYDDGTFIADGVAGDWTVVNGDTLKLIAYSGIAHTATIVSVNNNCLTLIDYGEETAYYNSAEKAANAK